MAQQEKNAGKRMDTDFLNKGVTRIARIGTNGG